MIGLREWMKLASSEGQLQQTLPHMLQWQRPYTVSAVNLAQMLTKDIILRMNDDGLNAISNLEVHVTAENVMVHVVDRSSLLAIANVELVIKESTQDVMSLLSGDGHKGKGSSCPRAICAALGKILLELFSCGSSHGISSMAIGIGSGSFSLCDENSQTASLNYANDSISQPPAVKRKGGTTASGNNYSNLSSKANNLLLEAGMPLSICRLVCDLLNANETSSTSTSTTLNNDSPTETETDAALKSVKEAFWDLTQMNTNPNSFLFDRICPQRALDDTGLFGSGNEQSLFGREKEIKSLLLAKDRVSDHVRQTYNNMTNNRAHSHIENCTMGAYKNISAENGTTTRATSDRNNMSSPDNYSVSSNDTHDRNNNFLCETVFLKGYTGSGKSLLLGFLSKKCTQDKWFVLGCKFDNQAAPHMILAKAFNEFFAKWDPRSMKDDGNLEDKRDPEMMNSFRRVCGFIYSTIDDEVLGQLNDLVPSFLQFFPSLGLGHTISNQHHQVTNGVSSTDKVGSADKRRKQLFHLLFKALCSAGRPVLLLFDDLQWSGSFLMKSISDFIVNYMHSTSGGLIADTRQRGMLIASAFRSNEVKESSGLMHEIDCIRQSRRANVQVFSIDNLAKADVTRLLSSKLCLPWRYTQDLAGLVHSKTAKGNPFYVVSFLKSIIQNKMLHYSMEHRRWSWDLDVVEMEMMSDGVAELLTMTFGKLPPRLMQTVKIMSCLGYQVDEIIIKALNEGQKILSFDIQPELEQAVKESIMEKAGPIYQFCHDLIKQAVYELVPAASRKALHKTIGESLLRSSSENQEIHLLATDQINIYCADDSVLSSEERAQFAEVNAIAAKYSIAALSFEQARRYIDAGIRLLEARHWESQYSLSLRLYEMSAQISFGGDVNKMSTCLEEILNHARTLEDSLNASALCAKLLVSQSKYKEAMSNCLTILSKLGEEIPHETSLLDVLDTLSELPLENLTVEQIRLLPRMTEPKKLQIMKFLSMLCTFSVISKPLLLPLLSCRMIELTLEFGFCEDSIIGIGQCAYGVFLFTSDVRMGHQIGKVCEGLIAESPIRHTLRSQLCLELENSMKAIIEPVQSVIATYPSLFESAMLVGDVECAMKLGWLYCSANFYAGSMELTSLSKHFGSCFKQQTKYNQHTTLHLAMAAAGSTTHLSGKNIEGIKSYGELREIGERLSNTLLIWQCFMSQLSVHFWMKDYQAAVKLSEKHPSSQMKRVLEVIRCFYEGIAYLSLARDTRQESYRSAGEERVKEVEKFEPLSAWNFENKTKLMQAELHYLNGNLTAADEAYNASIVSSCSHRWHNEEALAYELYGVFLVENNLASKGRDQLQTAIAKYKKWGAMKKAMDLQIFVDLIDPSVRRFNSVSQ